MRDMDWRTKPTDRFLLRMTKVYVSAPLTRALLTLYPGLKPTVLTIIST
jgi:hypothetical protein